MTARRTSLSVLSRRCSSRSIDLCAYRSLCILGSTERRVQIGCSVRALWGVREQRRRLHVNCMPACELYASDCIIFLDPTFLNVPQVCLHVNCMRAAASIFLDPKSQLTIRLCRTIRFWLRCDLIRYSIASILT